MTKVHPSATTSPRDFSALPTADTEMESTVNLESTGGWTSDTTTSPATSQLIKPQPSLTLPVTAVDETIPKTASDKPPTPSAGPDSSRTASHTTSPSRTPQSGRRVRVVPNFVPDDKVEGFFTSRVQARLEGLTARGAVKIIMTMLTLHFIQSVNTWIPLQDPTACLSEQNIGALVLAVGCIIGPCSVFPWLVKFFSGTARKLPLWEIVLIITVTLIAEMMIPIFSMVGCVYPIVVSPIYVPVMCAVVHMPICYFLQPPELKYNKVVVRRTLIAMVIVFLGLCGSWCGVYAITLLYYYMRDSGSTQIIILIVYRVVMVGVRNSMTFAMRLFGFLRPGRQVISFVFSYWIEYTVLVVLPTSSSVGVYVLEGAIAVIFQLGSVFALYQPARELVRKIVVATLPRRVHWMINLWASVDDYTKMEITAGIGFEILSHVAGTLTAFPLILGFFYGPSRAYYPYAKLTSSQVATAVAFSTGKLVTAIALALAQRVWLMRRYGPSLDILRVPAAFVREYAGMCTTLIAGGIPLPIYIMARHFRVQYDVTPDAYGLN